MWYAPVALHIPDGFLSTPLAILGWIVALLMIGTAIRQTRVQLGERQIPLMGVLAAFVFAAQAINFPVATGTSGHLLGGALIAIVMGPWAAILIMTAVVSIQGLIFQDGGLLVMGWNILNMGVLTAFTGFATYEITRRVLRGNRGSRLVGAFVGAWLSVEVGAIATAVELAVSNTSPLRLALPAMVGVHALIGLGEATITTGAISLLQISRPEVLTVGEMAPGRRGAAFVTGGLLVALGLAIFSPWASSSPDGLEFVAESRGFLGLSLDPLFDLLPGYTIPFIPNEVLTTILAVGFGTLLVFILALAAGKSIVRHQTEGK